MKKFCTTRDLALVVNGQEDIQSFLPAGTGLNAMPDGTFQFVVACKAWFIPAESSAASPNIELQLTDLCAADRKIIRQNLASILEKKHLGAIIREFEITKEDLESVALEKGA